MTVQLNEKFSKTRGSIFYLAAGHGKQEPLLTGNNEGRLWLSGYRHS